MVGGVSMGFSEILNYKVINCLETIKELDENVTELSTQLPDKLSKTTDLINNDTTGGADKALSAEVGKVLGQEIDAINTSLTNKAASITYNTTYANASISVFYNKTAKRISISNMTPLEALPAYAYTVLATINDVAARPSSTFVKVVTLDLNGATGYFKVEPNGDISVYPKVAMSTAIYVNEVIL